MAISATSSSLSVLFSTLCIIDLFGVFPIVALPRAIIGCGWLGIPLALCIFGVQVYTAILLGRCWLIAEQLNPEIAHKSRYPYAAIAEMTFGEGASIMVTYLLDLTVFGGGIPNLLVASQNLQMLGLKASQWNFDFSFCYWMLILGLVLCPIMWLGSPKDMKWVALTSVGTVLSVSVLTWTSLLTAEPIVSPHIPGPSWEAFCIAYGILAFQFDIHPVILTVQVDMAEKKKLGHAILGAFSVTGSLFLVTCLIAFFRFGDRVRYNLLQGLPPSGALLADELLVTVQICLSMVVSGTALFQDVEHKLGVPKEFTWKRCVVRSSLVLLAVLLGETVPRFDLVMGLIGGALTGPLMFILPPLFYARLRAMQPQPVMVAVGSTTFRGLRSNLATILDIHTSVDGLEDLRSRALSADNYGTFVNSTTTSPHNRDEIFDSPRAHLLQNASYFRDRVLSLVSVDNYDAIGPMRFWEKLFTACLVFAGVVTTVLSTFYTLRGTIEYATFVPPCIVNVTVASRAVIDNAF
ncbi:amino acid transporter AVT1E-like isoform X1 [Homalodisca vitripennis]|uniref:amino acid transporter AVT1E-like isoform X1 n=2 Tax=Homalodisca vitripennis TaxID=197043 RepID=UPI001EEC9DF5|nr:amino acid transporter AVT1E-like isoform X1 [Homalodisca vitripennis]